MLLLLFPARPHLQFSRESQEKVLFVETLTVYILILKSQIVMKFPMRFRKPQKTKEFVKMQWHA